MRLRYFSSEIIILDAELKNQFSVVSYFVIERLEYYGNDAIDSNHIESLTKERENKTGEAIGHL